MAAAGSSKQPVERTSEFLFAAYLTAVAATPYPGSYWTLLVLSAAVLCQAASTDAPMYVSRSLIVVLGWFSASVLWSIAPSLTARNTFLTVLITVAAAVMTRVVGARGSLRALMSAGKALLVLSWAVYWVAPQIGRTQDVYQTGAFEGVFVQRNVAAFFCVILVITFFVAATDAASTGERWRHVTWALLALGTLLSTQSGTGLAVVLVSSATTLALIVASRAKTAGRRRFLVGGALIPPAALALWLPFNLDVVSQLFGRDPTLTGRSVIWAIVERYVAESPWFGHGFGALWVGGVPLTDTMWVQAGFPFYHAHSAYLDHLAQVGIVGLVLVLLLLIGATGRAAHQVVGSASVLAMWPAGVSMCLLFYAIDEQSFASQFGWVLVVMVSTMVAAEATGGSEPGTRAEPRAGEPRAASGRSSAGAIPGRRAMRARGVRVRDRRQPRDERIAAGR
ncbi:O-antigen ligase family protein [Geodermatophilus sp. CPCC 206100]|uniref:O-antigen ligase family protein n=1 Tax=Geodermatophilus sp. CPCC 206100 TaxID=3020054 RepID=UPI003B0049BF